MQFSRVWLANVIIFFYHLGESTGKSFRISDHTSCRISTNIISYIVNTSLKECVQECRMRTYCAFLNYRQRLHLCELHRDGDEIFVPNSIATGPCVYISRLDIQNTEIAIDCGCDAIEACDIEANECSVKECELPSNLITKGNMYDVGSCMAFRCEYYQESGFNTTECKSDGSWNPKPRCYSYQGCYTDGVNRTLSDVIFYDYDHMTIDLCIQHCFGYKYIGLQFSAECYCGNTLHDAILVPDTECGMTCVGNHSQTCGSDWRLSTYKLLSFIE